MAEADSLRQWSILKKKLTVSWSTNLTERSHQPENRFVYLGHFR